MLKSDQDGIESHDIPHINTLFRNSWNQTKMGLKGNSRSWRGACGHGWNQTKMGLKDFLNKLGEHYRRSWNQTKMGLKAAGAANKARKKISWNQTKMGLKAFSTVAVIFTVSPLKSDQDGIESWCGWSLLWGGHQLLKSDQDGIESLWRHSLQCSILRVEIRPRWDWKAAYPFLVSMANVSWNQTKVGLKEVIHEQVSCWQLELKSDQGGIERWYEYETTFWTSHPLKSDQGGIESVPSWLILTPQTVRWNQTKVGLKAIWSSFCPSMRRKVLKSDQGGIER